MRAIVFDFDGVIANSEPLHFRAFRDVLASEGLSLTEAEYYERYLGFNDERAFEEIGRARGREWDAAAVADLTARKAAITERLEQGGSILFPGAREAIERLAAIGPLAIASGALRIEIDRTLSREGLAGRFAVIVSGDDGVASKPSPEPYQRAVEGLRRWMADQAPLTPAACVAIEDSPWGIASARAAGLRTVAVTHTYAADALAAADVVVESLDALTSDVLRTMAAADHPGRNIEENPGF